MDDKNAGGNCSICTNQGKGLSWTMLQLIANTTASELSENIARLLGRTKHLDVRRGRYSIQETRKVLSHFFAEKHHIKKKINCFYNFKGGVGKTSICFQTSYHLALCGYKVLVIDADAQGHLSTALGLSNTDSYLTLYNLFNGDCQIEDAIHNIFEGLDCIPANLALCEVENLILEKWRDKTLLYSHLERVFNDYDFIMFDTNPTISCLNKVILACSDLINIVVETNPYSMNGLMLLFNEIQKYAEAELLNDPDVFIIPNKYKDRSISSGESMALLNKAYPEYIVQGFAVRNCEDFNLAALKSKPLSFFCNKDSHALEDIMQLVRYVIKTASQQ